MTHPNTHIRIHFADMLTFVLVQAGRQNIPVLEFIEKDRKRWTDEDRTPDSEEVYDLIESVMFGVQDAGVDSVRI